MPNVNYTDPWLWVDLGLSLVLLVGVMLVSLYLLKKKLPLIIVGCGSALIIVAKVLGLNLVANIATIGTFLSLVLFLIINVAAVRPYVTNPVTTKAVKHKGDVEKVYDRYELCSKIATAVSQLSKTKTGALITFEKEDSLDNLVNTPGTVLNSPVVPELLLSIFYEGTRLHDGAVIIRRDTIYSAAAFFPPTQKPLTGKYGSRHRAAIGISEISDSVTVVVSEETGRISFAVDGELIHSSIDDFERMLQDYLISDNK